MFENREEALKYVNRKGFLKIKEESGVIIVFDRNMEKGEVLYKRRKNDNRFEK